MSKLKKRIEEIITQLKNRKIDFLTAWNEIKKLKDEYVEQKEAFKSAEQSWHSFIGKKFQEMVHLTIKNFIEKEKKSSPLLKGLTLLTESEVKKDEIISRKLSVKYGSFFLLPDVDSVLVNINEEDRWKSEILAIISCKTSLRERIAQACYWKLKLLSSDATKHIKVFLVTVDNDKDFTIEKGKRERFNGKSRNRIIAEFELDGIYILRLDFKEEWQSEKVKLYDKIFEDLLSLFKQAL
jgi:type II restriction enzyme